MKVIFDYCTQIGKHKHSEGECLVELEEGDVAEDVIKSYVRVREWWERRYHSAKLVKEHTYKKWSSEERDMVDTTVKGNLILFKTFRDYVD